MNSQMLWSFPTRAPSALRRVFGFGTVCLILASCSGSSLSPEDQQRAASMKTIGDALQKYFADNKAYPKMVPPKSCTGIYNNVPNLAPVLVPKYIASLPTDPKPRDCIHDFYYQVSSDGQSYVIMGNLTSTDPATYSDHWCIGSSAGTLSSVGADFGSTYKACP